MKVHQYLPKSVREAMLPTNGLKPSKSLQILSKPLTGSVPGGLLGPTQLPEHLKKTDAGRFSFQEIFCGESLSDHNNLD